MRKPISLILVILMLAQLASCGSDTTATETEEDTTVQQVETIETETTWQDIVPQNDYSGETFTVLVETNENTPIFERYWVNGEDGDILGSAVNNRNSLISELYNVNLQYEMTSGIGDKMYTTVLAGDYIYNLSVFHLASASSYIMQDAYMNWFNVPGVEFTNPWWSPSNIEDLSHNDILFTAIGDYALSTLATTYCMFFNTNMVENYGMGDIYSIVKEGKWTMDTLRTLSEQVYTDVNADNKRDDGDSYGFVTSPATALIAYNWALGGHIFQKNADGKLENVYYSEHTVSMFEKVYALLHENVGGYTSYSYRSPYGDAYHNMGRDYLVNGQAVFINGEFDNALTHFRDMEDDYGIIPYPKLDESQDAYYSTCNANMEAMTIPIITPESKLEMVGILSEALCAESYENVIPAYYEKALKGKAARDEQAIEMLDLIRDSRKYDFGFLFNFGTSGTYYASFMETLMNPNSPSKDIASAYASKETAYNQYFTDIFAYYDDYAASH